MSRAVGGVLYILGLLAALVTIWNIYFGEPLTGQLVIGSVGLALAFFFVVTLRENPSIQRLAVFGMMTLEVLMIGPVIWRAFTGVTIGALQIITATLGAILLFVNWRMLPR